MRYTDAAAAFILTSALGAAAYFRLVKRRRAVEGAYLLIERIRLGMEYSLMPLEQLFLSLRQDKTYELTFLPRLCELMEQGEDLPSALGRAIGENAFYTGAEKQKLMYLARALGTAAIEHQSRLLQLVSDSFADFSKIAAGRERRYGGASVMLGVFLGLGLFVLLL